MTDAERYWKNHGHLLRKRFAWLPTGFGEGLFWLQSYRWARIPLGGMYVDLIERSDGRRGLRFVTPGQMIDFDGNSVGGSIEWEMLP